MKKYQKAELIAKNLPTGSYAAGCPTNGGGYPGGWLDSNGIRHGNRHPGLCKSCEMSE